MAALPFGLMSQHKYYAKDRKTATSEKDASSMSFFFKVKGAEKRAEIHGYDIKTRVAFVRDAGAFALGFKKYGEISHFTIVRGGRAVSTQSSWSGKRFAGKTVKNGDACKVR